MKIELKNVKINARLSEETTCFSATLYVNGEKAGEVTNRGHGGPNMYHWLQPTMGKLVWEWAKSQPVAVPGCEELDQIVGKILSNLEVVKTLKNRTKKSTWFRLKGDKKGEWRTVKALYDSKVRAWLIEKYGLNLECIANEDYEAAANYC